MSIKLLDIELANLGTLPDGRRFEWEAIGQGDPMLWIEGGPRFLAHLGRPDAALLARWFRVHLVNAPGCGRTSPPTRQEDYDLHGHVAFFEAVRLALDLPALAVTGHSRGGLVATARSTPSVDSSPPHRDRWLRGRRFRPDGRRGCRATANV